jgi:uncharacterized FAD-dependent dehydrogenase
MIRIRDLKLMPGHDAQALQRAAAKALHVNAQSIVQLHTVKRAIDARKKNAVCLIYSVDVALNIDESAVLRQAKSDKITIAPVTSYMPPKAKHRGKTRPVVVGFGPAGMFCALVLAKAGLCPIVLERGCDAETRRLRVERLKREGILDPECNIQFGEGGAGTFSDGKLTTGVKNERIPFVLQTFVRFGADESILYDAKPHIGTDALIHIVQRMREEIISCGGEVMFSHRFDRFTIKKGNVNLIHSTNIETQEKYTIESNVVVLSTGHSARDTFTMLRDCNVPLEKKAFSMGVRIEHAQHWLNEMQYGSVAALLPPADYKMNCITPSGARVYTFCMCPGGYVVPAASELQGVVTNGMSNFAREGVCANSAVLVSLFPQDFPGDDPLAGMRWQQQIERRAFQVAGSNYTAPAQLVGDFLHGKPSICAGSIQPTYRPGVSFCNLDDVLPSQITTALREALPIFDRKLHGFAHPDAVLTAPETRSSSPIRILRDETRQSIGVRGLYPCGEGAGYAGGIMSAALDGILTAEAIIARINENV